MITPEMIRDGLKFGAVAIIDSRMVTERFVRLAKAGFISAEWRLKLRLAKSMSPILRKRML